MAKYKFCRGIFGTKNLNLNLKFKFGLIDMLLIWVIFAILIHILFQEAYLCEKQPISTNMAKNRAFRATVRRQ